MSIELKIPALGESIQEVQIGRWLKREGEAVAEDENVVELETDKASMELPAPTADVLAKILKHEGDSVSIGEAIAVFERDGQAAEQQKPDKTEAAAIFARRTGSRAVRCIAATFFRPSLLRPYSPRRAMRPLSTMARSPRSSEILTASWRSWTRFCGSCGGGIERASCGNSIISSDFRGRRVACHVQRHPHPGPNPIWRSGGGRPAFAAGV
jgi:pyruvate/2-oxoglutarate dehydrogenase complex dihydrolipoamide acyltransferase (E2) component